MTHLLALVGSARGASFNLHLARAARALAPDDARLDVATIADVPLYNQEREEGEGVPAVVDALKERVVEADGLLIVTPEYNHSIPGPLKNALDWLSRPPGDVARVFGGKPTAMMGATPGGGGTRFAQAALLPVLHTLGTRPWFGGQLYVAGAGDLFDDDMQLTDEDTRAQLREHLEGFVGFVRRGA